MLRRLIKYEYFVNTRYISQHIYLQVNIQIVQNYILFLNLQYLSDTNMYLTFRHRASPIWDRRFATLQRTLFIYLINKYISLSDICLAVHH